MLNHAKPTNVKIVRLLSAFTIISAFVLLTAMSQPAGSPSYSSSDDTDYSAVNQSTVHGDSIYQLQVIDKDPEFPGGMEKLIAYLQQSIAYPQQARKDNIEGTVFIGFVVEKDGSISNAKLLRGIGNGCDEEAMKAVNGMPVWMPGMKDDKPVRTHFNLPVKFTLEGKSETEETLLIDDIKADFESPENGSNDVFVLVEKMPEFAGGQLALAAYMKNAIFYPEAAKKAKVEGTVYITFVIEKDGKVSGARILRGLRKELDEVALDAINNMPAWIPGRQRDKPVRVQFNMPVKFALSNEKPEVLQDLPESIRYRGREIYYKVDVAPAFPGGNAALLTFLRDKTGKSGLKFASPEKDKTSDIYLSLIVEPDGSVTMGGTAIEQANNYEFKEVVKQMPAWKPGIKEGEKVPVKINLFLNEK